MQTGESDHVVSAIREAEHAAESSLEQACAATAPTKADTGELIRIDELLGTASDAVKRAISLRRRRRADKTQRTSRWAMGDAEAAASLGTTHRTFTDARGIWWDVFAVYPQARPWLHSHLQGTFQQGWLCFDSGTEKRRLSPIPDDWHAAGDRELELLAERAEVAASRRKRQPKEPGVGEDRPKSDS